MNYAKVQSISPDGWAQVIYWMSAALDNDRVPTWVIGPLPLSVVRHDGTVYTQAEFEQVLENSIPHSLLLREHLVRTGQLAIGHLNADTQVAVNPDLILPLPR